MQELQDVPRHLTRQRLYEQLVGELENLIVTNKLKPGSKLPGERELAEQFATSRTVVREAMKVLKSKGMVSVRHGSGVIVNPRSCWSLIDPLALKLDNAWVHLLEIRRILETEIAALASQRRGHAELGAIRQALEMEVRDDTSSTRIVHDMAFHNAIAEASKNPLLPQLVDSVADLMLAQREALLDVLGARQRSLQAHRRIYDAIAVSNAEEAAQAMHDHLQEVARDFNRLGWTDVELHPMLSRTKRSS